VPPPGSSENPSPSDPTPASIGSPVPPSEPGTAGGAGGGSAGPPIDTSGFGIGGGQPAPFGLLDGGVAFEGLEWAVPALVLTVPGLLLIAIAVQLFAGALWLPVARRWLGAFGVSRRRRREERRAT
jgi:hypothetical protein